MPGIESGTKSRRQEGELVYRAAYELFSSSPTPDWVAFFRKILGINGIVRRTYRTPEALAEFERSETHAEILEMLTRLREQTLAPDDPQEPTRVITVRMPRSLHEALRTEADEHHTSMNKLCISKLLQFIADDLVPKERWRRVLDPRHEGVPDKHEAEEDLSDPGEET